MDYDRIIAVSNDKTVYHHGDKRIKAYALKEGFVYALEEALKTAKVLNKTQLRVPPIYSVTANEKGVVYGESMHLFEKDWGSYVKGVRKKQKVMVIVDLTHIMDINKISVNLF